VPFLDVPALLQSSLPKPRVNWFWYGAGLFLLISLAAAYISASSATGKMIVEGGSVFVTIGIISAMSAITALTVRKVRASQLQIEAAAELVQLRRWPEAGLMLSQILSKPARTPSMRFEAMLYLTTVLTRYDRFDDAIAVYEHLLEGQRLDPGTERAIKLGRAMAMLRQDALVDADRAIGDLRRGEGRETSGGLALIEIYRDVKTGHPAEALATFHLRHDLMRDQLAHRVADAHALAAKAYDLLGQEADAQREFTHATLLSSLDELQRRYPELASLRSKYRVAEMPGRGPDLAQTPLPLPSGERVGVRRETPQVESHPPAEAFPPHPASPRRGEGQDTGSSDTEDRP